MQNDSPDIQQTGATHAVHAQSPTKTEDPGHLLALIGILTTVFGFAAVGTILSVVAFIKSKNAGFKNPLAVWGIVIGIILFVLGTLALIAFAYFFFDIFGEIFQKCNELGPGTHVIDGTTYICESGSKVQMRI